MNLSEKLKTARLSHKLSQKTLASALGVSRATVSAWENGNSVPPVLYLRRYQELFDFKKGYFDDASASSQNISFDVSALSPAEIQKLNEYYEFLLKSEENEKNY